ncbi:MAG TPA: FKBP-type peptidyl-prolyl cis-trans isomerase [Gemmatimonadaceae bacterium]|nr:FKBP-type peptidyl-prolyl cis-trans isomerase [Gemmatimonadaceae bacterium]
MSRSRPALPLAILAMAAACNAPTQPLPSIAQTTFASSLGINLSAMTVTADSLYYQDLTVGTGLLVKSATVITIEYTAWLPNGTEFDASSAHETANQPFSPGSGQAEGTFELPGWAEGIPGMHVGGTRLLIIPPALGYAGSTFGIVPANSILVYKITVTSAPGG